MKVLERDVLYTSTGGRIVRAQPYREQTDVGKMLCFALFTSREDLLPDDRVPAGIIARVASVDDIEFASVDV
jgi:hypothetical protein